VGENAIEFKLTGSSDFVVLNGVVTELESVIAEQRGKHPDAQICYHSLAVDLESPKKFTLTSSHRVVYQPKQDEDKEINANNIGKKESPSTWSSGCLCVLWVVRWAQKGLMPVKPVVHIWGDVMIPTGKCLHCTQKP
jgi:hypothetical protein